MIKINLAIVSILCLFFMSSCSLYKKPEVPVLKTPDQFKYAIPKTNSALKDSWWENFHDENLNHLVNLAIANNENYLIALKNIQIAQTYVMQNSSALYPQVNLNYNTSKNKNSFASFGNGSINPIQSNGAPTGITTPFTSQQVFGSVSYEVDAWNQVRNTVNQAEANVGVAAENGNVVKLMLISSVVNTYFQIATLNVTLANLQKQYQTALKIVTLEKTQYISGLIDIEALDDAKNQVETIKGNSDTLKKQQQLLKNTLSYLLGEYPEQTCFKSNSRFLTKNLNRFIPPHLPSEMLQNRPDIKEAVFQVLSYGYIEKQMLANFFPALNLTGNYGYASSTLAALSSGSGIFWNFGGNIAQYLLDFGLRKGMYENAKLQYESSILNYKNIVLNAFKEVDSALVAYKNDATALHTYQNQTITNKEKLSVANAQFQSGLSSNTVYLTSKLAYLQSSYNLANQQLLISEDIVQVYQTLGLGLKNPAEK